MSCLHMPISSSDRPCLLMPRVNIFSALIAASVALTSMSHYTALPRLLQVPPADSEGRGCYKLYMPFESRPPELATKCTHIRLHQSSPCMSYPQNRENIEKPQPEGQGRMPFFFNARQPFRDKQLWPREGSE